MTPMFAIIDMPIVIAIVGVALLLFGADKIPKLARSMGEAKKEFEAAHRGQPPAQSTTTESPADETRTAPNQPPSNPASQSPTSPQ